VTATDDDGATASDSITVAAATSPPTVTIVSPPPSLLFAGTPYVFQGTSFDPNEPLFTMPCVDLTWRSSNTADPFPIAGCSPTVVFQTVGPRTITLTGVDSFGLKATATASVTVSAQPNLPVASILSPHNGALLANATPVNLIGEAQESGDTQPLTYTWLLHVGATTTVLGTGTLPSGGQTNVPWTPRANVPAQCGNRQVALEFDVTDSNNQTDVTEVDVFIEFPTC
jgi:hypothetical protein